MSPTTAVALLWPERHLSVRTPPARRKEMVQITPLAFGVETHTQYVLDRITARARKDAR